MLTARVGMAAKSQDAEFDELNRRFMAIEQCSERLNKDSATFRDAVKSKLAATDASQIVVKVC